MKYLAQILALLEKGSSLPDQLNNILLFIMDHLALKSAYISVLCRKKRLISIDNPEGFYLKLLTSIGNVSPRDKFTRESEQCDDYYTVPIKFKAKYLGQLCLIGAVDKDSLNEIDILFLLIGMLMHFEKVNIEFESLMEEKEISKAKNMFMANVSHEIRTPLNAILGCLDYFSELDLPRSGQDVLEVMKHSSYNLLYLVNDILDITGLESDKMTIHLAPVSLQDIASDAFKIIHESKPSRVIYQQFIESDLPRIVITDPQRLKQIIINLLSNAFKFTEIGHVKLRISEANAEDLENLDLPDIKTVSLTPNSSPSLSKYTYRKNAVEKERRGSKRYIKVAVSDTGIGIKRNDIDKLFKSFSQIDSSSTKKYSGTGLGLAISAGICKLFQGNISLISEWKKGSTFYFVIPVQQYLEEADTRIDLQLLKGKNVLIVDDKVDNIVRLTNILDKYEITYQTTTNAKHAIASFINNKKYKFDLGLIDIYMPEMDGNQLAEYISKTEKAFPLIALSSANTKLNDITGSFDLTVSKPYTEEQLLHSIYNILNNQMIAQKGVLTQKNESKSKKHKSKSNSRNKKSSSRKMQHESSSSNSEFKANTNIEIRILVVEDNEYNQFTIKRMLNSLGYYNIDTANSGDHAIKMVQNNCDHPLAQEDKTYIEKSKYDIILMDVIMPVINGITTSRRIKRMFKKECAPIIFAVTANVVAGFEDECKTKGHMDGFITKPIDKTILAEHLSQLRKN
jgi:signal transduction histidine kinase/DNA-binding response OmpR family regulator